MAPPGSRVHRTSGREPPPGKRRHSPPERREELQGCVTIPRGPRCLSPFQGSLFPRHCLDFQTEDRLTPRWHVGHHWGKASLESLVGKRRGKASWESLEGKPQIL